MTTPIVTVRGEAQLEVPPDLATLARSSTSGLHIAPIFSRRGGTKITGYRGSFSTQIVVHNFEMLSALIFALTPLPNSQIDGPWWSLRRDNAAFRNVRLDGSPTPGDAPMTTPPRSAHR